MSGAPIADRLDHGLVSNGRVLALIAPDGAIAWFCADRFDGPALFCGILDGARGGRFVIEVDGADTTRQRYHTDSLVLRTEIVGAGGVLAIDDVCPMDGSPRLVRQLSALRGRPRIRLHFDPRPDYGRSPLRARASADGFRVGSASLMVDGIDPKRRAALIAQEWVELEGRCTLTLHAPGAAGAAPPVSSRVSPGVAVDHANRQWQTWLAGLTVGSNPLARRSALTLAGLVYRPTGAMIAAATTSLPEAIGEPRDWDYRYCWIRDGAFAADALARIGDRPGAERFLAFLFAAVGDDTPQPLHRVDGGRQIPESILPHLRGFAGTGPVRIGNAAAGQVQHDTHGQIVWLAHRIHEAGGALSPAMRRWLWARVEAAEAVRGVPDAGIWEFRDRPGQYTFSHLWCWVALDRGARLARAFGEHERAQRWQSAADAQRRDMLTAADRAGFFAQTLDGDDVDASSLAVAPLGLVDGDDRRYRATIERCEKVLLVDGLMRRYVAADDFGSTTSTFSLCTLWWIEALALSGRADDARDAFARFVAHGNPLGLFSEDIEPGTGRLLGNFPQACTHIGLLAVHDALRGSTDD